MQQLNTDKGNKLEWWGCDACRPTGIIQCRYNESRLDCIYTVTDQNWIAPLKSCKWDIYLCGFSWPVIARLLVHLALILSEIHPSRSMQIWLSLYLCILPVVNVLFHFVQRQQKVEPQRSLLWSLSFHPKGKHDMYLRPHMVLWHTKGYQLWKWCDFFFTVVKLYDNLRKNHRNDVMISVFVWRDVWSCVPCR